MTHARTPRRPGSLGARRTARGASSREKSGCGMRGHVREDEVDGLTDRLDPLGLVLRNPDSIAVLELHDELDEVEGVGLEVLLEAALLPDPGSIDSKLVGQVRADSSEHLFARRLELPWQTTTSPRSPSR